MKQDQIDNFRLNEIQSQILGVLVNEGLSAKEAIAVLDQAKDTYLSRSYHISTKREGNK